jgi:acyl-CoA synthetase (AMP-forming)/AMP-acid ligase II
MNIPLPRVHPSIVAMLDHTAAEFGGRPALVQGGESLTYTEMRRCAGGLAAMIGRHAPSDVPAGWRVATLLGNSLLAAAAP